MSLLLEDLIKKQEAKIEQLEISISELLAENKALRLKNNELEEKLGLNSKNSSIPSSKELYKAKKANKKPSNRKRGGQAGHTGHSRSKMQADEVLSVELDDVDCGCGGKFCAQGAPHIHQTVDIPPIKPHVMEYQLKRYRCNQCGKKAKAKLPSDVSTDVFGDNIGAIISSLTAFYKNSKRDVKNILGDVFNLDISLGSISNREAKISNKCKKAYEELESKVNNSNIVHIDETGHSNSGKRGWCWLFSSEDATLIKLEESRGKKVLKNSVFGPEDSIYVTDRYAAYSYLSDEMRQVCWAHLRRDFARFAGSSHKEVQKLGIYLEQIVIELFGLRNLLFADEIDIVLFVRRANKLRKRSGNYLKQITYLTDAKSAVGKAKYMMKFESMMWRFLYDPYGIPMTNNHAEQQIRHYVVYRKNSFFTQSDRGNRFLERLMSLFLTWRKNNLNPFQELSQLIAS